VGLSGLGYEYDCKNYIRITAYVFFENISEETKSWQVCNPLYCIGEKGEMN
jgi:hypothetical protein